MKHFFYIFIFIPFLFFAQNETRLALVIGNSNYAVGEELKNPVNDALLVAETLKKLNFDVILDTNIVDQAHFVKVVKEFGKKREDYDVAFVYYAGHGVQVGSQNYLIPTKVNCKSESDVVLDAFPVEKLMMFLRGITDKVNVLILDACRNNPFEKNWNSARSLSTSSGSLQKPQLMSSGTRPAASIAIFDNSISPINSPYAPNCFEKAFFA